MNLNFEKLPHAIGKLISEVDEIKKMLIAGKNHQSKNVSKKLSLESAIEFLSGEGYTISKSKIYKLSSTRKIPFDKFGKRLVFDQLELINWLKCQTVSSNEIYIKSHNSVVLSASKKLNSKNA